MPKAYVKRHLVSSRNWLVASVFLAVFLLTNVSVASAQLNLPYTSFTPGQLISSSQFTSDLTQISANALNRTGGTMTGTLLFSADNSFDIGASGATRPRDFWLGRNASVGGTLGVTGAATFTTVTGSGLLTLSGSAPEISLTNATSNWITWAGGAAGVAAPSITTQSVGTKLILFPGFNAATATDMGLGVESAALWQSVRLDTDRFYWYHGQTRTLSLQYDQNAYAIPTMNLFPSADSLGARIQIVPVSTANAPAVFQAGEPGVTGNGVILANNYHATGTGASARINTSVGGSYLRLVTDGTISLNRISSAGTISTSASWDAFGNFTNAGSTTTAGLTNSAAEALTAFISPAALAAGTTQNYNPAGLATTRWIKITSNGAGSTLGGLQAQSTGTIIGICPVSGGTLTISASDPGSSAANQFAGGGGTTTQGTCLEYVYDGIWRPISH